MVTWSSPGLGSGSDRVSYSFGQCSVSDPNATPHEQWAAWDAQRNGTLTSLRSRGPCRTLATTVEDFE